jgi:nitrogen regulatory protein PII
MVILDLAHSLTRGRSSLETAVSAVIVNEVVNAISATCHKAASGGISILVSNVTLSVRVRNFELVTEG